MSEYAPDEPAENSFDDLTVISRLGSELGFSGLKKQLDKHTSYLAERIETGRQNGISLVEVVAGVLAVGATISSLATFKLAR